MDQPIACTLSAASTTTGPPSCAALAARALRSRERTPDGERLVFAAAAADERELRAVIEAEASCCAFLRWTCTASSAASCSTSPAPQDARPIIAELFA